MSDECLSISFDNDQLNTILIPTTTESIVSSVVEGTKMVFRMSLPISKSKAKSIPLAKRSLIVSLSRVCSFAEFRNILRNETNARTAEIPIISPAAISIPKVR
jgi:hypothetical protein